MAVNEWREDTDGFLRCTACILKNDVLDYNPSEITDLPDDIKSSTINMLVDEKEFTESALKSLEGKPIFADHHLWADMESSENQARKKIGAIAGTPHVKDGGIYCDLLITDEKAKERIKSGENDDDKLIEISAGYRTWSDFEAGKAKIGDIDKNFHGIQRGLDFNHVAILPKNCGRGGADVRILNKRTKIVNQKTFSIDGLEIEVSDKDYDRLQAKGSAKILNEAAETSGSLDKAKARIIELEKKLKEMQGRLDESDKTASTAEKNSSDTMNAKINEGVSAALVDIERGGKIMNNHALTLTQDQVAKIGHPYRKNVIAAYRVKNKLAALSTEQEADEAFISGVFFNLSEMPNQTQKIYNGAQITNTEPAVQTFTHAERLALNYPNKGA